MKYEYHIEKVYDEKIGDAEVEKRLSEITKEFGIEAFTLTKQRIAWTGEYGVEYHNAFDLGWKQDTVCVDIRVICYVINKTFKGAQCCLNEPFVDGELYYPGHTAPEKFAGTVFSN